MENPDELVVSVSPHIRGSTTTSRIMLDVLIALLPAFVMSIVIFGARSALIVCVCVATCVVCEWIFEKALKRKNTISDLSACVTGTLLAFCLPSSIPVWQAVFGSFIAIILVKQLFGGLGKNFANPAITARIVMLLAFSVTMTTWTADGITGATPLALMMHGEHDALPGLASMLLGRHGGSLGETCAPALALGGIYLLLRRVISWHTPVSFIAAALVFTAILGHDPVFHILSGGIFLGAIFMATDYVTTPVTGAGKLIFGVGAGLLTVLLRVFGSYPEGVSFAILLMNILTPYINRLTITKPFGGKARRKG